MIIAV